MNALNNLSPHAHWLLRIVFAGVFLFHGLGKFPAAEGMAKMMGMPIAAIYMLGVIETSAGLLALYGGIGPDWATRIGGLLAIPVMLGAISMVHWPRWSFTPSETHPMGGMEFQVTILCISLYFLIKGKSLNAELVS